MVATYDEVFKFHFKTNIHFIACNNRTLALACRLVYHVNVYVYSGKPASD